MCGISAIISAKPFSVTQVKGMTDIIRHRGPDDEGFVCFDNSGKDYVFGGKDTPKEVYSHSIKYLPNIQERDCPDFKVGLGHRRLSIIDLSPLGHQPMCDSTGRYWIVFNGEIYNYLEIKSELISEGIKFVSESDTEVILESYKKWGVECQNMFNGMWSFIIYDKLTQNIFASRDRFGIKPLYYWQSPLGGLYFASEIKQFTVCQGWNPTVNMIRAIDYLYFSVTDHTEETLFKNVYSIPPGNYCFLKLENLLKNQTSNKLSLVQWYNPETTQFNGSFAEAKSEFLRKFKDSIHLHLRSDVTVGSALSGGLDSSSIVCYINSILKDQNIKEMQKTFSSCALDKRFDEKEWMDEVVKHTEIDAHFIYPKGEDIFDLSEKILWHMDEPYQSQSIFLSYHVFEAAKNKNVKVLLNGQGADEYLSGYGSYRILRHSNMLKEFKLKKVYSETKSIGYIIKLLLYAFSSTVIPFLSKRISVSFFKNRKIFNIVPSDLNYVHPYITNKYNASSHNEISNYQLFKDPLQRYLRWEDRNSMAHSVESRVPFLDYRLVEYCQSLPLEFLDGAGMSKRILVESMKNILPEKIRNRKDKVGYISSEELWFTDTCKNEFKKLLDNVVGYSDGIINVQEAQKYFNKVQNKELPFDYTYWRIINFCLWMKVFNVKSSSN